jgi:hypothetical protein
VITWSDYRDLLIAAHTQFGGPIMRAFADAQDWPTSVYLPAYAPASTPSRHLVSATPRLAVQRRLHYPRASWRTRLRPRRRGKLHAPPRGFRAGPHLLDPPRDLIVVALHRRRAGTWHDQLLRTSSMRTPWMV